MTKLFADAQSGWDLERLFTDLASIKNLRLTEWEKTCLRGLLCRVDPESIASQIFWTTSALRTELSRRIYPQISALVGERIGSWHKVSSILEKAGYKYPKFKILPEKILALVGNSEANLAVKPVRCTAIIDLLQQRSRRSSPSHNFSLNSLPVPETSNVNEGDLSFEGGNFRQAIAFYWNALEINSQRFDIVFKVAKCYEQIGYYRDSLFLCDYLLNIIEVELPSPIENHRQKSNLYSFLASIFHKLALKNYSSDCVKTAFDFYQQSLYFYPENLTVSWQIVDLFVSILQEKAIAPEEKFYHAYRANKAFLDFKSNAEAFNLKLNSCALLEVEKTFAKLDFGRQKQLKYLI